MWLWFHSGWMIVIPLAMMAVCILMCVLVRRQVFSGGRMCCGYKHGDSKAESERRSELSAPTPRG